MNALKDYLLLVQKHRFPQEDQRAQECADENAGDYVPVEVNCKWHDDVCHSELKHMHSFL